MKSKMLAESIALVFVFMLGASAHAEPMTYTGAFSPKLLLVASSSKKAIQCRTGCDTALNACLNETFGVGSFGDIDAQKKKGCNIHRKLCLKRCPK